MKNSRAKRGKAGAFTARLFLAALLCAFPAFAPLVRFAAAAPQAQAGEPASLPAAGAGGAAAAGQAGDSAAETSWLLSFAETKLSAPNRRIRLSGLQGALSSEASVSEITAADAEGVWLRIRGAKLSWNRLALLRGALSVNSLSADTIEILRKPLPNPRPLPLAADSGFSLPSLPLAADIRSLSARRVFISRALYGQAAAFSLDGRLALKARTLDSDLRVRRLDGAGGEMRGQARYDEAKGDLQLNVSYDEPQDGLLAAVIGAPLLPPLHFSAQGGGQAGVWAVRLSASAAGRSVLDGLFNTSPPNGAAAPAAGGASSAGDARLFSFAAAGAAQKLLPAQYQPFFGAKTELSLSGALKKAGGIRLDKLNITGGGVYLRAAGETAADGFLRRLRLRAALGLDAENLARAGSPSGSAWAQAAGGQALVLPAPGGRAKLRALWLNADYGAAETGVWSAQLRLSGLQTADAALSAARLEAGGRAENLDTPPLRSLSLALRGEMSGLALRAAGQNTARPAPPMALSAAGGWRAGQPLALQNISLSGSGFSVSGGGVLRRDGASAPQFDGALRLISADIAPLAAVFGLDASGSANLGASGKAGGQSGAFDLDFSGGFNKLKTDNAGLNALLKSDIGVSGGLKRDARGLTARALRVANGQFQLAADGALSAAGAHMDFSANLADIALLRPFLPQPAAGANPARINGALAVRGAVRGANGLKALAAQASLPRGVWNGRRAQGLRLGLNAVLDGSSPYRPLRRARLRGQGLIGGDRLDFAADLEQKDKALRFDNVDLRYGATRLQGSLAGASGGLWNGALRLQTADLAPAAALAFLRGRGSADISAALAAQGGGQNIRLSGRAAGLSLSRAEPGGGAPLFALRRLDGDFAARDIFNLPKIDGKLEAQGLRYVAYAVRQLSLSGQSRGESSEIAARAQFENGARLEAQGQIAPFRPAAGDGALGGQAGLWQLTVRRLALDGLPEAWLRAKHGEAGGAAREAAGAVRLQMAEGAHFVFAAPYALRQADVPQLSLSRGGAGLGALRLSAAVTAQGISGQAALDNFPLAAADVIYPEWGLSGSLSGTAHLSGAREKPIVDFDARLLNANAKAAGEAGLSPLSAAAKGRLSEDSLTLDAAASGSGPQRDLRLRLNGQADLAGQKLNFTADGQNAPLGPLAALVPGLAAAAKQKLSGAVSAHAVLSGSFAAPQLRFSAAADNLSALPLERAKAAPLSVRAAGTAGKTGAQIEHFTLRGPGNARFEAAGALPFRGGGLDMRAQGRLPLALLNAFLAARGAQADGALTLDARLSGALAKPQMQGAFAIAGGRFVDPLTNLRLQPINLSGRLSGNQLIITELSARSYNGGGLVCAGALTLDGAAGLPLNMRARLNRFVYNDGVMAAAEMSGALNISGALLSGAEISGKITVDHAEIRAPDNFGGQAGLDIENRHAAKLIAATQRRAGMRGGKEKQERQAAAAAQARFMPRLNIQISAPRQIFVRGRGLDAEMGGRLAISGRADAIIPSGGLKLIRGRLDILAQRLVFKSGQVTLAGNFNPLLDFAAVSQGDDVTVTAAVSGTPKDLKISLSSDPSLPQDEILARLIFKRSLSELSPIQAAQLAEAAAELTGLTHGSVLDGLRNAAGLDQLDVTADSAGNAGVAAGRYIMDKLYLGVETAAGGASKGTVNLDITPKLKAKGSVGTDSNSNLGVFYERDY